MKTSLRTLTIAVSVAALSVVGVSPATAYGSTASPTMTVQVERAAQPQGIMPGGFICRLLGTC